MAIKVFLCCEYKNDEKNCIDKLVKSLKDQGCEFINEDNIGSNNIDQNNKLIDKCDWFILLMTKQTTSQDSFCLRLLSYAKDRNIKILPVMIEKIDYPPIGLSRIQWVLFSKLFSNDFDNNYFQSKVKEIHNILSGKIVKETPHEIFISYGHDEYADILIKKIAEDLNGKELSVWIDYDFLYGSIDWEFKIQDGIDKATYVIVFITEHSMRRPDGYCLNEITYSKNKDKKLLTIDVELAETPLSIVNDAKIDFSKCIDKDGKIINDLYQKNLSILINVLKNGPEKLIEEQSKNNKLLNELKPFENDKCIKWDSVFVGRKYLFDYYEKWLNDKNSKVLCILGSPGSGKSAFISYLCQKMPNIRAVHYCQFSHGDKANPIRIIMSLAYQLSTQFVQYKALISNLPLLKYEELCEMDINRLFDYLILTPLSQIKFKDREIINQANNKKEIIHDKPVVLVLDGIDEISKRNDLQKELLNFIANKFQKAPDWIKLIITSRTESEVTSSLAIYKPIYIDGNENNISDIREYIIGSIYSYANHLSKEEFNSAVDKIVAKSEGNFLYINQIVTGIKLGSYSIDEVDKIPDGLFSFYKEQFNSRLFPDIEQYDAEYRPLLEILTCSNEPLSPSAIAKILDIPTHIAERKLRYLENFFPKKNNVIIPFHKSIVDWLLSDAATDYKINVEDANVKFSEYYFNKYKNDDFDDYLIKYLIKHCLAANKINNCVLLMNDENIFNQRIELLGINNSLQTYVNEAFALSDINSKKAKEVADGECFKRFDKYRKPFNYIDTVLLLVSYKLK